MQLQLRQNSEDLQSFLRDLDSWEEEIKEKDEGLKRRKPILKEVGRNSQILFHVMHNVACAGCPRFARIAGRGTWHAGCTPIAPSLESRPSPRAPSEK